MRRRVIVGLSCVFVGGIVIAGVAFAGRSHEQDDVLACTAVGCESGVGIAAPDLAYARPEVARVRFCLARRCRTVSRFAEGLIRDFERVRGSGPVPVRAALLNARGGVIASDRTVVRRRAYAPNGKRCGPICYGGGVHLTPSGRLVRPSAALRLPRPGRAGIDVIARGRVSQVRARRAATTALVVRRGDPISVRTDSRSYVRVYVRGHLPPPEYEPFALGGRDGRVWDAWVPQRLRGARELMVRLDHRTDGRIVRFRVPITVVG